MRVLHLGTNGWRARVGGAYDESSVVRIASALGSVWAQRLHGYTVFVGFDTRRNAQRHALLAGQVLASCGLRVVVCDRPCPTPALAWAASQDPLCIGAVMLTASEAPCEYGGILVRQHDGGPISSAFADMVDQKISFVADQGRGEVERADFLTPYLDHLFRETDSGLIGQAGLHVVIDPMHGAGAGCVSSLLERVGCRVSSLHDEAIPDFRGLHPDPCEPWVDECERAVVELGADLGIVLDGDCDRLGIIDSKGKLVSQHDIAPLMLEHLVSQRGMSGRVVATLAASARIERQALRLGCDYTMTPVGFESIYRELAEGDVILAADEQGGICFPHHFPERDAIVAALALLELVAGASEDVSDLVSQLEREVGALEYGSRDIRVDAATVQMLHNILPGVNPQEVAGMEPVQVSHADGLRLGFSDGSWLLVRPSRTRPLVRARAEAPTKDALARLLSSARPLCSPGAARSL